MPKNPETMYRWRKMSPEQRREVLAERRRYGRPPHSPPHIESDTTSCYLITAACFEHRPFIGYASQRMSAFEQELVDLLGTQCSHVYAWTILPNHYHSLVDTPSVKGLLKKLGQLHGRNSYLWNRVEDCRGRQVWCNAAETAMKSEGHFYATWNYVLNNAVRHGYVTQWIEWPYCNAVEYLQAIGRDLALKRWQAYPPYDFGKGWDPPEL